MSKFIDIKYLITVNSGSLTNLVALSYITSIKLGNMAWPERKNMRSVCLAEIGEYTRSMK